MTGAFHIQILKTRRAEKNLINIVNKICNKYVFSFERAAVDASYKY